MEKERTNQRMAGELIPPHADHEEDNVWRHEMSYANAASASALAVM